MLTRPSNRSKIIHLHTVGIEIGELPPWILRSAREKLWFAQNAAAKSCIARVAVASTRELCCAPSEFILIVASSAVPGSIPNDRNSPPLPRTENRRKIVCPKLRGGLLKRN